MQERNKMKIYRLDESVPKPDWWLDEDKLNESNPNNKVWVEEGVLIFGQIHYMAKYRLISRKEWKRNEKHRLN
ncbi:MAG: hypothetical protein ACK5V6_11425 [Pseudanabaena sp.]|jgi:hypothetical protein